MLLRTVLMLVTAVGVSVAEFVMFGGVASALLTAGLTFAGWTARKWIMERGANYRAQTSKILPVYFACYLIAKYAGLGTQIILAIITVGCMLMFNLNFWSITEAAVVDEQLNDEELND